MDRTISARVDASPQATIAALGDLTTYPSWLSLVAAAEPEPSGSAWTITLRARLGRLARSKRLRMIRTAFDDQHVRFERRETDGRNHAEWILEATVDAIDADTCDAKVHLHYGGALWSAPLDIVLSSFEGSAADRLSAYLASGGTLGA